MQQQIQFYEQKLSYEIDSSDLYKAIENNSDYVIIDTRQPSGYEKEHIPGAVNLPHREMTEETTRHFSKSKVYVCYCDGIGCNASTKGALAMTKLGFTVKELIGGIVWWKLDGYTTEGSHQTVSPTLGCTC
ncbi:rhodanese-like domain-containing protein [Chryseobacterium sp. CT-SW4]|uniref:rhodanese-like domain-containing protein n=1 Tax=Chryseobacterium sp. SW-1 TaxID=3157343 RepID=UPI003B01C9C8